MSIKVIHSYKDRNQITHIMIKDSNQARPYHSDHDVPYGAGSKVSWTDPKGVRRQTEITGWVNLRRVTVGEMIISYSLADANPDDFVDHWTIVEID